MRRVWKVLLAGFLWGFTACLGAVEALLAFKWFWGMRYIAAFGGEENPYAAEEAEVAGICAVYLLPLFLAALACAVVFHKTMKKKQGKAQ